jgi:hypothetical protein
MVQRSLSHAAPLGAAATPFRRDASVLRARDRVARWRRGA